MDGKFVTLVLSFGFLLSDSVEAAYRVEVPLDTVTTRTLIKVIESKQAKLGSSIKYGEFKRSADLPYATGSLSCWTWIYREPQASLVHEDNRVECRWMYGNNDGLATFSWRLADSIVRPLEAAKDSMDFEIEGPAVNDLIQLLVEEQQALQEQKLAVVENSWLKLVQDEENRFPQIQCHLQLPKCRFVFPFKTPSAVGFELGEGSSILAEVLLNDQRLAPYVAVVHTKGVGGGEYQLQSAHCSFEGAIPERGQFALQTQTSIKCSFEDQKSREGYVVLNMDSTSTQIWGTRFQRYHALTLSGSVTKVLYESLRERSQSKPTHMLYTDYSDIGKIVRSVNLRRFDDTIPFPDFSLKCSHETYVDSFTLLFQKYFPDVYKGRVEYYICLLKSEQGSAPTP